MPDHPFLISLDNMKRFFDRSTSVFEEQHSVFAPKPEMYTVAQHVAQVAQVIDWFIDGAFSPKGLDTDFEKMEREVRQVKSLTAARAMLEKSMAHAKEVIGKTPMSELMKPIAPGIMGGAPRVAIFEGLADHTAHHRGALAVYARLLNLTPANPYM